MSKRAEELALEAYDRMFHSPERMSVRSVVYPTEGTLDYREPFKPFFLDVYQQGYEQAKRDLALTIDDMERIHTFLYAIKNNKHGCFTFTRLSDEQYEEAIRRFNEYKEKK